MGSCHFEKPCHNLSPCVVKSSHLSRGGGATLLGSAKCRTYSREPLRVSRWKVSSASTISEKLTAGLLPMMENTSIRQRQIIYLLSPSRRASLRTDCGVTVHSIFRSTTMNGILSRLARADPKNASEIAARPRRVPISHGVKI